MNVRRFLEAAMMALLIVAVSTGQDDCETASDDDDTTSSPLGECDYQGAGTFTLERYATVVWGHADWENTGFAAGEADSNGAHTQNLDSSEDLYAAGWTFCHPTDAGSITKVEVSSRGMTQYESGSYDILVRLSVDGAAGETLWHHTDWEWDTLDVTTAATSWSWADVNNIVARTSLDSHPNGNRDSDVWVDAFRVRVTYTNGDTPGDPGSLPAECYYQGLGTHVIERYAASTWGHGDWEEVALARGAADEVGTHTENLDAGEDLYAGDWEFCIPEGAGPITKVEVASRGETQYESGSYDILVSLSADGLTGETLWHHTSWAWDTLDATSGRSHWTWSDVNNLVARISLYSHPNGYRDSDVWVDTFRVRVTYCNNGCDEEPPTSFPGDDDWTPYPGDDDVSGPTPPPVYVCMAIGTSNGSGDGFFSLESFGGKLFAGLFGYGHDSQSMLYSYPPYELTSPGLTGISESVCAMHEYGGYLYANTESSGDIFRSPDGSYWERVYDGSSGSIGCGLEVFNGQLYAINYNNSSEQHGKIMRLDGSSWTTVYDSGSQSMYIREIVAYNSVLYAFAVMNEQGQMLWSTNGADWQVEAVANRYFRGHVWNGYLWLGSTDYYANGEVGVFRFDGVNFVKKYTETTKRYVTDILDVDGHLFAGTSNGWKNEAPPSSLLMSPDGETGWRQICEFPETAVWDMAIFDGELYLGSWYYQHAGILYKVVDVGGTEPVDCSPIAANPSWELCESGPYACAGVFTDGAGCEAFCAAAGLECTARYGGEPGCQKEPEFPIACDASNDHMSDWCECGPGGTIEPPPNGDCTPAQGSLAVGATYTVEVDAHTGDEETTEPKTDANDGSNGDRTDFRRYNVARAHNDYWYTSAYQEAGEPDPNGPQWVDYTPDFAALGVGRYQITAQYRATEHRATYPVRYEIQYAADGDVLIEQVQQQGDGEYIDVDLGVHHMCPGSSVRIEDPGNDSITFNKMGFTYLGE